MIAGVLLHINIGEAQVDRCPKLEILSMRHRPLDVAYIDVPDPFGTVFTTFSQGDPVRIEYGYRGGSVATWAGTVRSVSRVNRDQVRVSADSEALPLLSTRFTECYADESSVAIARHILQHAGLPIARISLPEEPLARFPVSHCSVWEAAQQLLHSLAGGYGHNMDCVALWLGAEGLNLGNLDEPGPSPEIATSKNLIKHLPVAHQQGQNIVETYLVPGLTHSRRVRLHDTRLKIKKAYRALQVRHEISDKQVRTIIGYGGPRG